MRSTRCKMRLEGIFKHNYGSGVKVIFHAEYDQSIPEDRSFSKATPSGSAEFVIDNPAVMDMLVIGGRYYFDITPMSQESSHPDLDSE